MMSPWEVAWGDLSRGVVRRSPIVAACVCAVALAAIRRRHPKASLLLALGVALMAFEWVVTIAALALWPNNGGMASQEDWIDAVTFVGDLASAVALALIFAAVFVERSRPFDGPPG